MSNNNRATFYPNPNEESEPWIERSAMEGFNFRIWHVILICLASFITLIILCCCCIKIRIPRTKQDIEADYRRKLLAEKFRQRLKLINNQDFDVLDLNTALRKIQEDFTPKKSEEQSMINYSVYNVENEGYSKHLSAEPQSKTRSTE